MNTYDWLKHIPSALLQKDSSPLIGFPPHFPWEQFSTKMAEIFQMAGLTIKPADAVQWRADNELLSGLGDRPLAMQISVAPTGGTLYLIMAEHDIASLMAILLTKQDQPLEVVDPDFMQGFYQFIVLEAINTISQLEFDKSLSAQILQNKELPNEASLCLDIAIQVGEKIQWGRVVLSAELQQGWKERYAQRTMASTLSHSMDLTIHLEAGRTSLSYSAWSKVVPGDFIMLDSCSLKSNGEGRVVLTIEGTPLFRGEIKGGNINILEYPLYDEVDMATNDKSPDDASEDKENEASAFEDEFDEDKNAEGHESEIESENNHVNEDEEEVNVEEDEQDLGEFSEDQEGESQEKWPPPPESRAELKKKAAQKEGKEAEPSEISQKVMIEEEAPAEKEEFSIGKIPMSVVVEVGRVKMTIQKLMELQPGNLLELNVRPENGVDLVVNGKRIAKGELLLIGDALGVRVLDIG